MTGHSLLGSTVSTSNLLLRSLPPQELQQVLLLGAPVRLDLKHVLARPNQPADTVYFVEAGTVSMIMVLEDGAQVEVGLVGFEGVVGIDVLLGAPTCMTEALVQVEGQALSFSTAAFAAALRAAPCLQATLLRYVDSFLAQVAQSAVCNSRHQIEQRLARWLLMTHDRVLGDTFSMTQEFLSSMLGATRPSVTLALGSLEKAGLVQRQRGRVMVTDRPGLEGASCECYAVARRRYAWLAGLNQK